MSAHTMDTASNAYNDCDDSEKYRWLAMDFYERFFAKAVMPPRPMVTRIRHLVGNIEQWAIANPAVPGTRPSLTPEYIATLIAEACPLQFMGSTIMGIAGNDMMLEDFLPQTLFAKLNRVMDSKAGIDIMCALNGDAREEADNQGIEYDNEIFHPLHVVVWSLWTWHQQLRRRVDGTVGLARRYWRIVRPRIMVSFGEVVTGVVHADFRSTLGLSQLVPYLFEVGKPKIHYHTEHPYPHDDDAFICIPHIHPGQDKYTDPCAANERRRVVELTWQLTMAIGNITLDVVEERSSMSTTRLSDAEEVLRRWTIKCRTDPATIAFMEDFEQTKHRLGIKWRDIENEAEFQFVAEYGKPFPESTITKIREVGVALGEPGSFERQYHLGVLWNKKIADLHTSLPHHAGGRKSWEDEFLHLPEGRLLFIQVMKDWPNNDYVKNLVQTFIPERKTGEPWRVATVDEIQQAIVSCELWITTEEAPIAAST